MEMLGRGGVGARPSPYKALAKHLLSLLGLPLTPRPAPSPNISMRQCWQL